jgi:hypothetical protein
MRRRIEKFGKIAGRIRTFGISGRKVRIAFCVKKAKRKMMGIYLEKKEKVWHKDRKF